MLQEMVRLRAQPRLAPQLADDGALDEPHRAIWRAVRHLFPAHAMVDQVDYALLLVSWKLPGRRGASAQFAAPVMIRIEAGLLLALWTCEPQERDAIAREQEDVVRACLDGYDPHSRVPTCGVIVVGCDDT
jgi:hypothetical protein